jgi:imidazolonepropionase-like amidohydrolase
MITMGPGKMPLHVFVFVFAFVFGSAGFQTATLPGCSTRPELEITNVNIIDVTTGMIRFDATLAIGNGCICRIGAASPNAPGAVRRIDGRGRYALPGLWVAGAATTERDRLAGYGITNVTGTPAGSSPDAGELYDHLAKRVARGETPLQAIQSVTSRAAQAAGARRSGQLAPGYEANVILLEANPLTDISNLRQVSLVVVQGRSLGLVALARARAGRGRSMGAD